MLSDIKSEVNIELRKVFKDKKGDEVIIRNYNHQNDREKLIDMYFSFTPENRCLGLPPSSKESIEYWIDHLAKNGLSIVAEFNSRIIGHTAIVPTEDGNADLTIFVHQDFQNRGIGQELLKNIIEVAKKLNFRGITLVTEINNKRAIHIYKKFGFRVVKPYYEYDMYLSLRS